MLPGVEPRVSWPKPRPFPRDEFQDVAVGGSISNDFNLLDQYTLNQPGTYKVTVLYRNFDNGNRFGLTAFTTNHLPSTTTTFEIF